MITALEQAEIYLLREEEASYRAGLTYEDHQKIFDEIIYFDVASGDARPDTIKSYRSHLQQFLAWCEKEDHAPARMGKWDIKRYRKELLNQGLAYGTVALKLTVLRRFFQGLIERDYISDNPALGVSPPRDRAPDDNIKYLTAEEVERFLAQVRKSRGLRGLRDRAMIAMMLLEGWRVVEVARASVENINFAEEEILTRGKGKNAFIYPRRDTLILLKEYLATRGDDIEIDNLGTPLFISHSNLSFGKRMSRNGIRKVINGYLKKAQLKRPGISCHALRHTCGMEIMQQTGNVKAVQLVLRHEDVSTSGKYAHLANKKTARYSERSQISI